MTDIEGATGITLKQNWQDADRQCRHNPDTEKSCVYQFKRKRTAMGVEWYLYSPLVILRSLPIIQSLVPV
jgi:hypothetical protein